jgi:hypothetical protein
MTARRTKSKSTERPTGAVLNEMIAEATVDAHDESEQAMGWEGALSEYLELPFTTKVLGVEVSVNRLELRDDNRIVAICTRGREHQAIGLLDLPLPSPRPAGAEWVEAYRYMKCCMS